MTSAVVYPGSREFLARTYTDRSLRNLFSRVLNLEYSKKEDININSVLKVINDNMQEGVIEEVKEYVLEDLKGDLAYILAINYIVLKNKEEVSSGVKKMSL